MLCVYFMEIKVVKTNDFSPLPRGSGFSVGQKPVRANNMEITTKIRKDLLLLECYARPNNPREGAEGGRGDY